MLLATPAAAQEPVFPKTVTIVIAFEPAGSYDVFARLVARHIGRHLPGQPQVIAQNMPGAGGLIGANYLAQVAPRDGSVIGEISQTAAIGQALETPGVRYDVRTLNWIGRMTSNVQLLHAWKTSKAKSIRDVLNTEMIVAGTGPTSSSVVFPRIMNDLIGTKFRVVPGFQGAATATLAMERGEVDAVVRPWTEIKVKNPDWVREKTIFPIVQFSLARHADLPDIPTVVDLGREEAQRQLLALFASGSDVSNALLAPPGVPASTLETLRRAFIETGSDPQLLAEARTANLELDWMSGADLQALIAGVFKVQPDVIARAKQYNNNP
jgi:tripartite-type tricarboxylate transporter receptor subunit TctC